MKCTRWVLYLFMFDRRYLGVEEEFANYTCKDQCFNQSEKVKYLCDLF